MLYFAFSRSACSVSREHVAEKRLESHIEDSLLRIWQEEYIKEEQRNLKRELLRAQEEVRRIQSVPLVIGQFLEMVDQTNGIVGSTTGWSSL